MVLSSHCGFKSKPSDRTPPHEGGGARDQEQAHRRDHGALQVNQETGAAVAKNRRRRDYGAVFVVLVRFSIVVVGQSQGR